MTDNFTIAISNTWTGAVLASATVEVNAEGARLTEVRAETGVDGIVPEALAHIDFQFLVRTANMLSSLSPQLPAIAPSPSTVEALSTPPMANNATPASPHGDRPAPAAVEEASSEKIVNSSSSHSRPAKRTREAHERAQLQRDQRTGVPSDFGVTYWRLGSIAKVARHYEVPNHIAQDWIKSLQQQGKLANPWPAKGSRTSRSR